MSLEANKALTRRMYEDMNKDNVDALFDILHVEYREETELSPDPLTRDSAVAMTRMLHAVVPGLHRTVLQQIAEGDTVVDVVEYSGKSEAAFRGLPAGLELRFKSVFVYRIEDGAIRETWSLRDRLSMYEQAGVTPEITKSP
jgi:predicted ester cyclase